MPNTANLIHVGKSRKLTSYSYRQMHMQMFVSNIGGHHGPECSQMFESVKKYPLLRRSRRFGPSNIQEEFDLYKDTELDLELDDITIID